MKKNTVLSRLTIIGLALFLVVSAAATGCSSKKDSTPDKNAPAEAQGLKSGGVLRICTNTDSIVLGNPPEGFRQLERIFAQPAVETLVCLDETGSPAPWLATGWKADPSANTMTLTLREGVKFHDGTDFNAHAVKWNLDQYKASKRPELGKVKSIDVVNDYTVRFNLTGMDNLIIPNLATIPGMIISPASYQKNGKDWANVNPVGTGPFKFVSWQRNVRIEYQKFDGYWQKGKPYLDKIEFIPITDPMVRVAAFKKGDADVILDIDPKDTKDLEAAGNIISKTKIPTQLWGLFPDSNNKDSAYANVKVRQAIWHAIDTKAICSTLGRNFWEPLNQTAVSSSWAFNPNVKSYPYDPEKAKQLLAEAGYPNGFTTTINGLNTPPNPDVMVAVQDYLKKVGIEAKVDPMDKARFDKMVAGGGGWKDGLTLLSSSVIPNDFAISTRLLGRDHVKRLPSVFVPDEFVELVEKGVAAPDQDSAKTLAQQLQAMGTDKHSLIMWLYATTGVAAKNARVQGDGLYETLYTQWKPQDAWLKK